MENNLAIKLTNISKRYYLRPEKPSLMRNFNPNHKGKEFWALSDINLSIKKGDRIGIIGPNGAGKTTLLKIIAGITKPTTGAVETQGKILSLINLEAGFHPELTGIDNIFINGMLLGMTRNEVQKKLSRILSFAQIGNYIYQPLYTYSAGMILRLGFAIGIHHDPDIMIIDESINVGDASFRLQCKKYILSQKKHVTLIVTDHNIHLLHQLTDKIIHMENSKIVNQPEKKILDFLKETDVNEEIILSAGSNSMWPAINKGDKVRVKKIPFEQLKINDIIAFTIVGSTQVFVHRIIKISKNHQGTTHLTTKGDLSEDIDPWKIYENDYIGKIIELKKI